MALSNYSSVNTLLHINGVQIDELGQSDTPIQLNQLDEKNMLLRGMNGSALRYTRVNEGWELVVSVLPGTANSTYLSALANSPNASIIATYVTVSTGEVITLTEGVFMKRGSINRGGSSVSDDEFTFQFNLATIATGK